MNTLSEYKIQYSGLKLGHHKFNYIIKDSFFTALEFTEISSGEVKVDLDFEKQTTMLILKFHISGWVEVVCDRCADTYKQEIECNEQLIVKFGIDNSEEINEDIVFIDFKEYEFDISQYLYEFINISIPMHRIHPNDKNGNSTCDKEMLKLIDKLRAKETNPKWDLLKNIEIEDN